jgi:hypothetical protein
MNNFKEKLQELEQEFQSNGTDTLSFDILSTELRWMIRDYCERNGIEEVSNQPRIMRQNALNRQKRALLQEHESNSYRAERRIS